MKALIINGWGQVHDSISGIIPKGFDDVAHINYAAYKTYDELVKTTPKNQPVDMLIGWSLGGQIACRLVEQKILQPKLLVLIATPFQFVADEKVPFGMNHFLFQTFKSSFSMIPLDTLKRFAIMIAQSDSNMKKVIEELGIDRSSEFKWLEWLEDIGAFSCFDINFANFPRTIIIHGDSDTVVDVRQAQLFEKSIPNSILKICEQCGHAPHLHDPETMKELLQQEIKNINAGKK